MEAWSLVPATETFSAERTWFADGIPVLTATLALPRPTDRRGPAARRIDRFYQLQGRSYLRYCEGWLAPQAAAAFRLAAERGAPLCCHTSEMNYCVTCAEDGLWSVRTVMRECAEGRQRAVQRGDTWSLQSGWPLPLSAFFPPRFPIRKTLLAAAAEEIRRQESAGTARYHEAWRQELRRAFSRENFYVTPRELCFFWQKNAVAPAAEGFPTFRLPFDGGVCRRPAVPEKPQAAQAPAAKR